MRCDLDILDTLWYEVDWDSNGWNSHDFYVIKLVDRTKNITVNWHVLVKNRLQRIFLRAFSSSMMALRSFIQFPEFFPPKTTTMNAMTVHWNNQSTDSCQWLRFKWFIVSKYGKHIAFIIVFSSRNVPNVIIFWSSSFNALTLSTDHWQIH